MAQTTKKVLTSLPVNALNLSLRHLERLRRVSNPVAHLLQGESNISPGTKGRERSHQEVSFWNPGVCFWTEGGTVLALHPHIPPAGRLLPRMWVSVPHSQGEATPLSWASGRGSNLTLGILPRQPERQRVARQTVARVLGEARIRRNDFQTKDLGFAQSKRVRGPCRSAFHPASARTLGQWPWGSPRRHPLRPAAGGGLGGPCGRVRERPPQAAGAAGPSSLAGSALPRPPPSGEGVASPPSRSSRRRGAVR